MIFRGWKYSNRFISMKHGAIISLWPLSPLCACRTARQLENGCCIQIIFDKAAKYEDESH
jgi:hypothetical protein